MNIRIDDDVPLPEPSKPDTWVSGPKAIRSTDPELDAALTKDAAYIESMGGDSGPTLNDVWPQQYGRVKRMAMKDLEVARYPAEPTCEANGVLTVDCYLVGGPLNGKHGPIVGTAQVVELNLYDVNGNVASIELYELGANKQLGVRHHAGSKLP